MSANQIAGKSGQESHSGRIWTWKKENEPETEINLKSLYTFSIMWILSGILDQSETWKIPRFWLAGAGLIGRFELQEDEYVLIM